MELEEQNFCGLAELQHPAAPQFFLIPTQSI
jgi:hypothetical protein